MFERFTEIARRAIFFARYEASQFGSPRIEAERLNHKRIETTHLLLGILRDEKSFGSILLREQGIEAAAIESLLATTPPQQVPASADKSPHGPKEWSRLLRIIFSLAWHPACVDILSQAVEQAKTLQHDIVMPEHLLLAML